jgi:putative SOS response-associated peptidase YedK
MCSRYSLSAPPEAVRAYFGYREQPNFPARYNVAPTQPVPVVRRDADGANVFVLMRWGFVPSFVKDLKAAPTLINARAETALEKPSFRNAFRRRRCLLPADGFYEWTGAKGARRPFLMRRTGDQPLFALAGIWECWQDGKSGSELDTVAILTCAANRTISALHDRMPVVLTGDQFDSWLDGGESAEAVGAASALAKPAPEDFFEMVELDPRINNSKIDQPGIQLPLQPALL